MIRRFAFAALLLGAVACGDDSDDKKDTETKDAGSDASTTPVPMLKVSNTGAACKAATDCQGPTAQCKDKSPGGGLLGAVLPPPVPFPGGFCSATCTSDIECRNDSNTAVCPLAPIFQLVGQQLGPAAGLLNDVSTCMVKCTSNADCRSSEGWRCIAAGEAYPQLAALGGGLAGDAGVDAGAAAGQLDQTFCFPPAPVVADAGTVDSGTSDAGDTDAATGDAGVGDASTDATVDAAP